MNPRVLVFIHCRDGYVARWTEKRRCSDEEVRQFDRQDRLTQGVIEDYRLNQKEYV